MNEEKLIAVTGASGQVGRELAAIHSRYEGFRFEFLTRAQLAVDSRESIEGWFSANRPAWFINCAAYTAVDKAESDRESAMAANGEGPGIIARCLASYGGRLIHLSTDYVFPGDEDRPLAEDAPTDPVNYYGLTKREGEIAALRENPATIVLRTAWVYSEFGNNFVKTMIRLMRDRESINVVDDQAGSPTSARDLAEAVMTIASGDRFVPGIFHYSNEGRTTWFGFASKIRELLGSRCVVNPVPTSAFPTPARRPRFSLLDKSKIKSTYRLAIPDWETSLGRCFDAIKQSV